jgi:hypothetical protein
MRSGSWKGGILTVGISERCPATAGRGWQRKELKRCWEGAEGILDNFRGECEWPPHCFPGGRRGGGGEHEEGGARVVYESGFLDVGRVDDTQSAARRVNHGSPQ